MKASSLSIGVFLLLILSTSCESKTIYVAAGGTGDGTSWGAPLGTITAAITLATTDDQIWVKSGEYKENVLIQNAVIHLYGGFLGTESALDERNWRVNKTTINASGKKKSAIIISKNVIFDGFFITGGTTSGPGPGISLTGCSPTIRNCTVYGNSGEKGGGFYVNESSGTISDCTITNNTGRYYGGGLFLYGSSTTFERCYISDNYAKDGAGIYSDASTSTIKNSRITDNYARETGGGAYLYISNLKFINCIVYDNMALTSGGGFNIYDSQPQIVNCVIVKNSSFSISGAIYSNYSTSTVKNCILWNVGDEIFLYSTIDGSVNVTYSCIQGGYPGTGNLNVPPLFVDPTNGDFHLLDGSPCINSGTAAGAPKEDIDGNTRPQGSQVDMGAFEMPATYSPGPVVEYTPRRIYVAADATTDGDGSSWSSAAQTISSALWKGWVFDEFWVAKGEYHEYLIPDVSTTFYGGFAGTESSLSERVISANETIINASGYDCTAVMGQNGVIIDGFTITGGKSNIGGGIRIFEKKEVTVRNCKITGNSASTGGGIYIYGSVPNITHCSILNNSASTGSGIYCTNSHPRFEQCHISTNSTEGIYLNECAPTISECTIENNKGYGISMCNTSVLLEDLLVRENRGALLFGASSGTVNRCRILDNYINTSEGSQNCRDSDPVFNNCLFANNFNTKGGVFLITFGGNPTFVNCTLVHNRAIEGSGFYLFQSGLTLKNCIMWNDGDEIANLSGSGNSTNISFSCIQEDNSRTSNINVAPLFVDPAEGDYHLANGSPCIDRGTSAGAPSNDLDQNPRSQGAGVDMGAYEAPGDYTQGPLTYTPKRIFVRTDGSPTGDGSSWANATSSISRAIQMAWDEDEIWVAKGRYSEAVVLDATASIYGGFDGDESALSERDVLSHNTIIDASRFSGPAVVANDNARLSAFAITGGRYSLGAGVLSYFHAPRLDHCRIYGNVSSEKGGGFYGYYADPSMTQCLFDNNISTVDGAAIEIESSSLYIEDCTITDNRTSADYGHGGGCYFLNSNVSGNHFSLFDNHSATGGGIYAYNTSLELSDIDIQNNISSAGGGGISINSSTMEVSTGRIFNNHATSDGGGFLIESNSVVQLEDCSFTENRSDGNYGALAVYSSKIDLSKCILNRNRSFAAGGASGGYNSSFKLSNTLISHNRTIGQGGIFSINGSSLDIIHSTLYDNTGYEGCGGIMANDCIIDITNSILWNRGAEFNGSSTPQVVYSCVQGGYSGAGNINVPPEFISSVTEDFHLQDHSPCIDRGIPVASVSTDFSGVTRPQGSGVDMGVYESPNTFVQGDLVHTPQRFYVNHKAVPGGDGSTWAAAFQSIDQANTNMWENDEAWVARGTYYEPIVMDASNSFYGGFKGDETILDERDIFANESIIAGTDEVDNTIFTADKSLLDGLTITGSKKSWTAAISCIGSSPIITNCTIENNTGFGVMVNDATPVLEYNRITKNSNAGIYSGNFGKPVILHTNIYDNGEYGILSYDDSSLNLQNSTIRDNHGPGIYGWKTNALIQGVTISNNINSGVGGGIYATWESNLKIINTLIYDNQANSGGGIYNAGSTVEISNCVLYNNKGTDANGGLYSDNAASSVVNSILWNPGREIYVEDSANPPQIHNCCIQGGYAGTGNLDKPPRFADISTRDFHLLNGSPCIDSGTSTNAPTTDLDQVLRPQGKGFDIGAYEAPGTFSADPSPYTPQRYYVSEDSPVGGDGSSWPTAFRTISEAMERIWTGDDIWISQGHYNEALILEASISLTGGFAGQTGHDERDWSLYKTIIDATSLNTHTIIGADHASIDGCHIQGGNSDLGGGVYLPGLSMDIRNCTITHNKAPNLYTGYAGLYCNGSSVNLTDCILSDNTGIGLYACNISDVTLINCTLARNITRGKGAAINALNSTISIDRCTIDSNVSSSNGGGLYGNISDFTISKSTISNNTSTNSSGGGFYFYKNTTNIDNTMFLRNSSYNHGTAIYADSANINMINCTAADNHTSANGIGALCGKTAVLEILNSIFCNIGKELYLQSMSDKYSVTNSCIEGGFTGTNNIQTDPLFADAANGDYHIQSGSLCRNAGIGPTANPAILPYDIDGDIRSGETCDIGADEYNPTTHIEDWFQY